MKNTTIKEKKKFFQKKDFFCKKGYEDSKDRDDVTIKILNQRKKYAIRRKI